MNRDAMAGFLAGLLVGWCLPLSLLGMFLADVMR